MSTLLVQVMEVAQTLDEGQLREVLEFVNNLKSKTTHESAPQPFSGKALLEALQKDGLIDELPDLDAEDEPEPHPISYTGKPLSEIIIEERGPK